MVLLVCRLHSDNHDEFIFVFGLHRLYLINFGMIMGQYIDGSLALFLFLYFHWFSIIFTWLTFRLSLPSRLWILVLSTVSSSQPGQVSVFQLLLTRQ